MFKKDFFIACTSHTRKIKEYLKSMHHPHSHTIQHVHDHAHNVHDHQPEQRNGHDNQQNDHENHQNDHDNQHEIQHNDQDKHPDHIQNDHNNQHDHEHQNDHDLQKPILEEKFEGHSHDLLDLDLLSPEMPNEVENTEHEAEHHDHRSTLSSHLSERVAHWIHWFSQVMFYQYGLVYMSIRLVGNATSVLNK